MYYVSSTTRIDFTCGLTRKFYTCQQISAIFAVVKHHNWTCLPNGHWAVPIHQLIHISSFFIFAYLLLNPPDTRVHRFIFGSWHFTTGKYAAISQPIILYNFIWNVHVFYLYLAVFRSRLYSKLANPFVQFSHPPSFLTAVSSFLLLLHNVDNDFLHDPLYKVNINSHIMLFQLQLFCSILDLHQVLLPRPNPILLSSSSSSLSNSRCPLSHLPAAQR